MKSIYLLSILVAFLLLAVPASAKIIQLRTSITLESKIVSELTVITIDVHNTGDEAAHSVQMETILSPEFKQENVYIGRINPDQRIQKNFTVNIPHDAVGTYPLFIKIQYSDANSYKFSSLHSETLRIKETRIAQVQAKVEDVIVPLEGSSSLNVKLLNNDEVEHNTIIRLHLSDDILSDNNVQTKLITPKGLEALTFTISNFKGLVGSTYFGFLTAEYDVGGIHFTAVSPVKIEIQKELDYLSIILQSLIVLVCAIIVFRLMSRARNKRKTK